MKETQNTGTGPHCFMEKGLEKLRVAYMWKEVRPLAWKIKLEAFDASKALVSIKQRAFNFKGGVQDSFKTSRINNASIRYNNPEDQNPCK